MTDLVYRLRKRAEIRRQIPTRRSVQEGKPDRLADLLDEAADELERRGYHAHSGIRCSECGDVVVSKGRHDFVWCSCKAVFVDGGCDYQRSGFMPGATAEVVAVECPRG